MLVTFATTVRTYSHDSESSVPYVLCLFVFNLQFVSMKNVRSNTYCEKNGTFEGEGRRILDLEEKK